MSFVLKEKFFLKPVVFEEADLNLLGFGIKCFEVHNPFWFFLSNDQIL